MLWRCQNLLQRCKLESLKELMICSLSLCQGVVQHMPYLSQDSCWKNLLKRTKINNLHLSNWRRFLAGFLSNGYSGLWGSLGLMNRLSSLSRQCIAKWEVKPALKTVLMIVHVGVNQGSVLNQLLFIMVEAITLKFINGCPWECLW